MKAALHMTHAPNPSFCTLDTLEVRGKTVLLRMDLNVPMEEGRVADDTRIMRQLPTLRELATAGARVVILSHFDRPKGKFVPSMSLAPLVDALADALGREVKFGVDCIGPAAKEAVSHLKDGDIILLENLRFHAEEEKNDARFAADLASLGNLYVNDAFSCSHRAHASVVGLAELLPNAAGRLMQQELETLSTLFAAPKRPLAAIVGGAKVSTKLTLLENLMEKVDVLMVGGAMANTFLHAQGFDVGTSKYEADLLDTARLILKNAAARGCDILLPLDAVVARAFAPHAPCGVTSVNKIPADAMALDIGPATVMHWAARLSACQTLVWNGPVGAFETAPFDAATVMLARHVAALTAEGKLQSVAGGGDTVAALSHAGLTGQFSYISTAGGAFLEWLEGKELPGVAALRRAS